MENYARFYKKAKIKYIFDPGQMITALSPASLISSITGAEILIGNDYEIGLISQKTGWTTNKIIDKVDMLVVTMGEKGSVIYSRNKIPLRPLYTKGVKIPAVKVKKCVDPTGAGDAYRAGLIRGMVLGYDIRKAGQLASAVASFAVEKAGTQEHRFGWKDIKERYGSSYKQELKMDKHN